MLMTSKQFHTKLQRHDIVILLSERKEKYFNFRYNEYQNLYIVNIFL